MGPNSGGGKNNKGKAGFVCTRARFSAPPKNLVDRIKKKNIEKAVQKHEDSKQSSGKRAGGPNVNQGSGSSIKDIPLDKKRVEDKALERLNLPQKLLTQLLALFEGPIPEEKVPTVRAPREIPDAPASSKNSSANAPETEVKVAIPTKKKGGELKPAPEIEGVSKHKPASRGTSLHTSFSKFGFLSSEIKEISKNNKCVTDRDYFLGLLVASMKHTCPTAATASSPDSALPPLSEELTNEIEVLTSMYGSGGVSHEHFSAFGLLSCCLLSVSLEINDVNFDIRIFILNADQYPNVKSKLYGWLIDPVSIAVSKSSGVTHATCMSSSTMRELSITAMEKIQQQHGQNEAPVAYDFIQLLDDSVCEYMTQASASNTSTTTTSNKRCVAVSAAHQGKKKIDGGGTGGKSATVAATISSGGKGKGGGSGSGAGAGAGVGAGGNSQSNKGSKGKKQAALEAAAGVEEAIAAVKKGPVLPPVPSTCHINGAEYRSAYSAALGSGLKRRAAQAVALNELEFILPSSVLAELRKEIAYDEAKMNMSFCVANNVGTKEIIEGARVLSELLDINKAAGKSLFLEARDAMLESGEQYGRTEEGLKKKMVACALEIHKEKIEKKEEKRKEKEKQKQLELSQPCAAATKEGAVQGQVKGQGRAGSRGLTIRAAYEVVEATKAQAAAKSSKANDANVDDVDLESMDITDDDDRRDCSTGISASASASASASTHSSNKVLKSSYGKTSQAEAVARQPTAPQKKNASKGQSTAQLEKESSRLLNLFNNKKSLANYIDWLQKRSRLPAFQMKSEILTAIESNSVVVISGDTGCGKTTQVPQLVLDDYIEKGRGALCNIIVTQPRRISAVSVAEQIARERVEKVGLSVGYHIRLEAVKSAATRLLLMTTGVLLRKLQADDCNLEGVSHIFVDEVHERDINTDFLLIVLKKMLTVNPHIKIVLMSATLNADLFIDYFQKSGESREDSTGISCALISIPGRAFPVNDFYLEDVLDQLGYEIPAGSDCALKTPKGQAAGKQGKSKGQAQGMDEKDYRKTLTERNLKEQHIDKLKKLKKYNDTTLKSLAVVDESVINLELIQKLVVHIISQDNTVVSGDNVGAILIFVPGLADIRNVIDCLNESPHVSGIGANVKVFPLHSSLSSSEQSKVFQILPHRARKIIVSTNIAETSVTIEDVVFVIDTCRVKENSYDDESQMNVLQEEFISQANARQRRGRAGRVRSGVCFHLLSRFTLEALPAFTVPEMLRMSLEDLILQVLALDLGDPYVFLGEALSPPDRVSITSALMFLESLSAVNFVGNQLSDNSSAAKIKGCLVSEITPLGFHLAALPISPRLGKLMLYGVLLKCIDPILTIISTVSAKSPFISSFEQRDVADMAKQTFLHGNSDLLSALNAYDIWKGQFAGSGKGRYNREEEEFCRSNFLSSNSLKLIDQMRGQFLDLLKDIGFISGSVNIRNVRDCDENSNGSHIGIIKCALCAGLSPNILMIPPTARDKQGVLSKKLMEVTLTSCRKGYTQNVHPSSIMSDSKQLDSSFVAYLEAMKTSKVYARDVTTISPITLALFCGKMSANMDQGVVVVNGWLTFSAVADISRCLGYVRDEVEEAFVDKVLNPDAPQSEVWCRVLALIKEIV